MPLKITNITNVDMFLTLQHTMPQGKTYWGLIFKTHTNADRNSFPFQISHFFSSSLSEVN